MTTDAFLADCRARLAFDLLSNTWNAVVLWALRDGPKRPVELRERIGGISSKVLTETLRRLQFNGLVDRQAHPGAGDHVPALCTDDLEEVPGVWAGPASSRAVHHLCGGGGA
ncbi:helix-turn-helix transcriptional regulator [Streptomyces sp. NBC_01450]|uniref:winged helix-turn-helix transcriptional regulator n=1 Tax=Streptomyces sp. NBC_01450 TaxID=2903871 RepID=UPI002E36E839|nr:helix-turn-helix domain-containing protein [Streptomyces sp. NBC_01450]